ncbi:LysE family translocator [Pinibacter aurantiacus]|uniref:LysE family translocator n=1 Tax=Pinibacter aurantiacus TaxID=2851599 RepID=A0A9E2S5N5_9BACT|nr:LysE family translocator [Pinibacter aurantiacus]MBV4356216.1 LysE family translocator [Pinibacter aurantiacus]
MTEALVKGLALGLVLAMSVGPVIFTVIKQSLNNGKEGGFSFVAGVWISDFVLVFLSNIFSEAVSTLLEFKKIIGYGGSSFLIGLGLFYIFFKKVTVKQSPGGDQQLFTKKDFFKIALQGFLINTLNPSVILFWLVNATTFSLSHTLEQRIIIFSTCLILNMAADVAKVLLAGKLRKRLTLHNISIINKISGTLLIGFGIALLYSVLFLSNKVYH